MSHLSSRLYRIYRNHSLKHVVPVFSFAPNTQKPFSKVSYYNFSPLSPLPSPLSTTSRFKRILKYIPANR